MPHWRFELDLRPVFHAAMPFDEKRDEIVRRIRASIWYARHRDDDLEDVCLEIEDTQTPAEFDRVWSDLYDVANEQRCWIVTR